MAIVRKTLEDLPDQTQKIFKLSRFQDKSRKEIAKELGVSQQTVDYHINKALAYLLEKLKEYIPLLFIFIVR
jgi:RNA polymerase sigma-70 factor (ECF subfamily)